MSPFQDLRPQGDVKGGARTPTGGVAVSDYQYAVNGNGNGVWKAIATGLGGIVCGLLVAWFTAFIGRGVSQKDMEDYIKDHSPYAYDKQVLTEHNATQDSKIGELTGKQDQILKRLSDVEYKISQEERDITTIENEVKIKDGILASLLEAQKVKK